jgi:uncharacterized protein (DUF2384 family)
VSIVDCITARWLSPSGTDRIANINADKKSRVNIMTKDGRLSPEELEALRNRFQEQSRKAQAYYTVMHEVREIAGSDDSASAWMNEPLPKFDGKTPAELVGEGRADDVLAYIGSMKSGVRGL